MYADLNQPRPKAGSSNSVLQFAIPIFTAHPKWKLDDPRRPEVDTVYVAFIAENLMPLFPCIPAYTLPSRKQLSNKLFPELAS